MGLFSKKPPVEERTSLANPDAVLLDAFGVSRSYSGERVNERTALGLAGVYSAVEKISEAVGTLPLKVYRSNDNDEREEARAHRMWRILHDAPNEYTTAHSFWSTVTASLLLRGNAFLLKERDENDEVESLWLLEPNTVTIEWDGNTKRFVVYYPTKKVYTTEDVVHVMGFSLDGWVGCSRITYAKNTLGNALARQKFEGTFYGQGAKIRDIRYPGPLGEKGEENLRTRSGISTAASRTCTRRQCSRRGRTSIDPMTLEGNAVRRECPALLDRDRRPVEPPARLPGRLDRRLADVRDDGVEPDPVRTDGDHASCQPDREGVDERPAILPRNRMDCEFVIEGLLRADMRTRVEYWKALKDMGVVDADYIAARENLPPPPTPEPVAPPPAPVATNGAVTLPASTIGG